MSWVQLGKHKIHTTQICYMDQEGDTLRVHFQGQWAGNPLELNGEAAIRLWRFLKAEDILASKDKGSATVLPRLQSARMMDVPAKPLEAAKPASPAGAASPAVPPKVAVSPAVHSSSNSSQQQPRPAEVRKH